MAKKTASAGEVDFIRGTREHVDNAGKVGTTALQVSLRGCCFLGAHLRKVFAFEGANFDWWRVRGTERSQYFPSGLGESKEEGRGTRGEGSQEWANLLQALKGHGMGTRQPHGTGAHSSRPGEIKVKGQGTRGDGSQEWTNFLQKLKKQGVRTWQPHGTATRSCNELQCVGVVAFASGILLFATHLMDQQMLSSLNSGAPR